jgi:hypothetical protein
LSKSIQVSFKNIWINSKLLLFISGRPKTTSPRPPHRLTCHRPLPVSDHNMMCPIRPIDTCLRRARSIPPPPSLLSTPHLGPYSPISPSVLAHESCRRLLHFTPLFAQVASGTEPPPPPSSPPLVPFDCSPARVRHRARQIWHRCAALSR